jgi:hypothetical protein
MKHLFIILLLFIAILNSYSQTTIKRDYIKATIDAEIRDSTLLEIIIANAPSGTAREAANGLHIDGNNVVLGDTLDRETTISGASYNLYLGQVLSKILNLYINVSSDFVVNADDDIEFSSNGISYIWDGSYWINQSTNDTLATKADVETLIGVATYKALQFQYDYSTSTTDSRPGSGLFRLNNATPSSVTQIYVDDEDINSFNQSNTIALIDTGSYWFLYESNSIYANYKLTGGITDASGYTKLNVEHQSGSGVFTSAATIKHTLDLSKDASLTRGIDSLYNEDSQEWLTNGDTITVDSVFYADIAGSAPLDSVFSEVTAEDTLRFNYAKNISGDLTIESNGAAFVQAGTYAWVEGDDSVYIATDGTDWTIEDVIRTSSSSDTLSTKAYARSLEPISFGLLNQVPYVNVFTDDYNYSANFSFDTRSLFLQDTDNNTFIGDAHPSASGATYNVIIGDDAGYNLTSGDYNTMVGTDAGENSTNSLNNTFIGHLAGFSNTTQSENTFIGSNSGLGTLVSGSVFLGYQAGASSSTNNRLMIDNSNTSTPLLDGYFANDSLRVNGQLVVRDKITTPDIEADTGRFDNLILSDGVVVDSTIPLKTAVEAEIFDSITVDKIKSSDDTVEVSGNLRVSEQLFQTEKAHGYAAFADSSVVFTFALTDTYYHLTNATDSLFRVFEQEFITFSGDTIITTQSGHYKVPIMLGFTGSNGNNIKVRLYNYTQAAAQGVAFTKTMDGSSNVEPTTYYFYIDGAGCNAGDRVGIQIGNFTGTGSVTLLEGSVFIEKSHELE